MKRTVALIRSFNDIKNRLAVLEAVNALKSMKEEIEDLNAKQMLEGEQPNGSNISPDYADESYARFKQSITPNSKRGKYTPNLKLTGSFHRSIKAIFHSDKIELIATDSKSESLLRKYGSVLGLSIKNRAIIIEDIKAHLFVFFKTTLNNF